LSASARLSTRTLLSSSVATQAAIRRPDILKENPGIAFGAVGKLMGEEWRAMPEDIKAPYVAKAEAAKAQYDKDKAAYGESPCPRTLSRDCLSAAAEPALTSSCDPSAEATKQTGW
jgi:hypothetical protein